MIGLQAMKNIQLIYASRPLGFDELTLLGILHSARTNNVRDGVTGALICRHDLYLQLLEGPPTAVNAVFERIQRDERHIEVVKLFEAEIDDRLFPEWAMRHDPAHSWMWTAAEVSNGAVAKASPNEIRAIFDRLVHEPPAVA